jgi:hypothetical protein
MSSRGDAATLAQQRARDLQHLTLAGELSHVAEEILPTVFPAAAPEQLACPAELLPRRLVVAPSEHESIQHHEGSLGVEVSL